MVSFLSNDPSKDDHIDSSKNMHDTAPKSLIPHIEGNGYMRQLRFVHYEDLGKLYS